MPDLHCCTQSFSELHLLSCLSCVNQFLRANCFLFCLVAFKPATMPGEISIDFLHIEPTEAIGWVTMFKHCCVPRDGHAIVPTLRHCCACSRPATTLQLDALCCHPADTLLLLLPCPLTVSIAWSLRESRSVPDGCHCPSAPRPPALPSVPSALRPGPH